MAPQNEWGPLARIVAAEEEGSAAMSAFLVQASCESPCHGRFPSTGHGSEPQDIQIPASVDPFQDILYHVLTCSFHAAIQISTHVI